MNVGTLFSRHARYRPEELAVVFQNRRLSYSQFNSRINRLANALLKRGLKKGDRVATLLSNRLELLEIYWACAKTGAVAVPLSTMLRPNAVQSLVNDAEASFIFTGRDHLESVRGIRSNLKHVLPGGCIYVGENEAESGQKDGFETYRSMTETSPDSEPDVPQLESGDLFMIMYSSGTTGMPKGIMLTHEIRAMYGACFASSFRISPESVVMHAGAIIFNGAFVDLMPTVFTGAAYVLLESFDAESFIETIYREKVTHVMMVPAQVIAVLNSPAFIPEKLESLEMILSLGAPLLMEDKKRLNELLPGRYYELYGLTEGFVTVLDKFDYKRKPKSVGVPPPLFEMKIMDENRNEVPTGEVGEICGKGPILMKGYLNRPDLTEKAVIDGWLYSGDLGYVDEDGYLYLVDRKKDMILSGGVNVYPRDIEEIAAQHPAVNEVAVYGIPDNKWGETPCAAVTLVKGSHVEAEELKKWVNEKVDAAFQRLSKVVILDEFPRNVAGKVLKRELRKE